MKLSDPYNTSEYRGRANSLAAAFAVLLFLLLVRMWFLQIWKGDEYRLFSDQNRFKIVRLSAPRGQILDRNGQLLADNRPRFDVYYLRGYATDVERELESLQEIFKWSPEDFAEKSARAKKASPYRGFRIARDIRWDQLAQLENHAFELSGVSVQVLSVRDYLYGDSFFHVLGYMGEVGESDLRRLKERFPERNYRLGDEIGVFGAERIYERFLRGTDGQEFVVVDVKGRSVEDIQLPIREEHRRISQQAGTTLQLSLDLELQLSAIQALGDQIGAAIAMDPNTGEVLAMVSRPALDPNLFTQAVSSLDLQALRERPGKPFLDRTLGEHYPPGSTFKILMAAAALEEGVITPETIINCPGYFRYGRRVWHDHNRAGFGKISVRDAIKRSSNVFFFNIGLSLGLDVMHSWASYFGLGRRTNVGMEMFNDVDHITRFNSEQSGFIPSVAWVESKRHTSVGGETINAGIGQGGFLTTITQLARMLSVVANQGKVFQPQLVRATRSPDGRLAQEFQAKLENKLNLSSQTREVILDAMMAVVNEPHGTAWRARAKNFLVGGKTGTSQVVSLSRAKENEDENKFQDHALFIGVAPIEDPQIVVAVIVENAGSGGREAAPVAGAMMRNYLSRQLAMRNSK